MSKKTDADHAPPSPGDTSPERTPRRSGSPSGDGKGDAKKIKGKPRKAMAAVNSAGVKSFANTLAARSERSLAGMYRIQDGIPEHVIEWSLKCFGHFDAAANCFSKEMIRDPLLDELDPWEIRESLFLGGRHEVTDQMVVEMIRSVGKVEHSDIRVNFREYVTMCWKWFFEEPPDTDEASDVRDAFLILGGGPGTDGQVETSKLKEFATELNLTIDVDKFVGEVDEDGSGKVDFGEFCKLFAASKVDSNLHDTGEIWLRHDKDETLAALARRNIGRSASPTGLTIDTDDPKSSHADAATTSASRPSSAFFDARCTTAFLDGGSHEQPVKIKRHREGFFEDDGREHVNSGALLAPKMKKVLQSSAPKFDRRVYSNTGNTCSKMDTKCRRGWRCSQMNRNTPKVEGYNFYHIKSSQAQELESTGIKLRKRGAEYCKQSEYTIKEHSSARINVRLPSEMRCLRQMKFLASQPPSRAATAMGLSSDNSLLMTPNFSPGNSRPQTVPTEGMRVRQSTSAMSTRSRTPEKMRGIAEGELGRSLGWRAASFATTISKITSSWAASTLGPMTRNYSYKDPLRPKDWLSNMKTRPEPLPTADLLKMAASTGMYVGRGFQEKVGPGYSFLDD